MVGLTSLLVPIVLSAVIVFVASFIIHMSPWHQTDYPKMANEEAVRAAMGPLNLPPGDYYVPRPSSMAEMKSPEFDAKMRQGPVVVMTVFRNGPMSMGRNLGLWFLYCLVVSRSRTAPITCVCSALPASRPSRGFRWRCCR
jgi:hypothetical protein